MFEGIESTLLFGANLVDAKLRTGMQMTGGDWSPLYTQPIPIVLFVIAFLVSALPLSKSLITKR